MRRGAVYRKDRGTRRNEKLRGKVKGVWRPPAVIEAIIKRRPYRTRGLSYPYNSVKRGWPPHPMRGWRTG